MVTVYLALGTNLGDRADNLRRAVEQIGRVVTITAVSSTYETAAWGVLNQPDFFNSCLAGTTELAPHDLLDELKRIEGEIGRQKTFRWGPRLIDIDILFYDDIIIEGGEIEGGESDDLIIPHPRIAERLFVLEPLCEIAADFIHPVHNKTIAELLTDAKL